MRAMSRMNDHGWLHVAVMSQMSCCRACVGRNRGAETRAAPAKLPAQHAAGADSGGRRAVPPPAPSPHTTSHQGKAAPATMLREAEHYDYQPARHNTEELLERSTIRRYWRRYLLWDLSILWWLRRSPTGRFFSLPMRHVIAYEPWRDISLVTWLAWVVTIFFSGYKDSVNCILNCGGVLFVRALIQARRPIEFDVRLRQLADSRGQLRHALHQHAHGCRGLGCSPSATWKPQYFEFKCGGGAGLDHCLHFVALMPSRLVWARALCIKSAVGLTGIKGVAIAAHYVVDRIQIGGKSGGDSEKRRTSCCCCYAFGLLLQRRAASRTTRPGFLVFRTRNLRGCWATTSQRGGAAPGVEGRTGVVRARPPSLLTARMRGGRRGLVTASVGGTSSVSTVLGRRLSAGVPRLDDARRRPRQETPPTVSTSGRVSYPHQQLPRRQPRVDVTVCTVGGAPGRHRAAAFIGGGRAAFSSVPPRKSWLGRKTLAKRCGSRGVYGPARG